MLQEQWRERVAVSYFQMKKVAFDVPGRDQVGRLRKVLGIVVAVIVAIPMFVFMILVFILNEILEVFRLGKVLDGASRDRLFQVQGAQGCLAETAGDAIKDAGEDIWIAWSHTHAALLGADRILWQSSGPDRPRIELTRSRLTWPDGSTADLRQFSGVERKRLQERNGNP